MDEKPDKKRESIDEILSDLNGLLNKMPSILDGIKMPELQPEEAPKPAPQEPAPPPEPAAPAAAEPPQGGDADKTVVMQVFQGLPEGAPEPQPEIQEAAAPEPQVEQQPAPSVEPRPGPQPEPEIEPRPEPAPDRPGAAAPGSDAGDKTVIFEPFADLSVGDTAPGGETPQPEPQSEPAPEPAAQPLPEPEPEQAVEPAPQFDAVPPPALEEGLDLKEKPAALPAFENTRDFGVPDIDALLQISSDEPAVPADQPHAHEAGVLPEALHALEESGEVPIQGLDQAAEPQPEVEMMGQDENKDENGEGARQEPAQEQAMPEAEPAGEQPAAPSPFDSFAIDPSSPGEQPGQQPEQQPEQAAGGLEFEHPAEAVSPSAGQPEAQPAAEETIKFDLPSGQPEGLELSQPQDALSGAPDLSAGQEQTAQPAAGGLELSPRSEVGSGGLELAPSLELGSQPPAAADETLPGGSGLALGAAPAQSGDETLVVNPPQPSSGEEVKTVIFQAAPAGTSRAQAGDLADLAAKNTPEGIPEERVRPLMFLYSPEDKALCATILAELDAICLKSAAKPMFVKRVSVEECDPDVNPNAVLQSAGEAKAAGLVCVGSIPQDKVYELENAFTGAGAFFRFYDSSSFSHSAALDLVTDLIVR